MSENGEKRTRNTGQVRVLKMAPEHEDGVRAFFTEDSITGEFESTYDAEKAVRDLGVDGETYAVVRVMKLMKVEVETVRKTKVEEYAWVDALPF